MGASSSRPQSANSALTSMSILGAGVAQTSDPSRASDAHGAVGNSC
jgi:hypothetical protein